MKLMLVALAAAAMASSTPHPKRPGLLDPAGIQPALVLPPPPAEGSAIAADELRQLHEIDAVRTPAMFAHAKADNDTKNVSIFAEAVGPGFDMTRLPATRALFDTVRAEEKAAADVAKHHFKRRRPWVVDATLHPCGSDDDPLSSYPSGHVTMGYAMGAVLSRLMPDHAPAIMARAADYAHSRLVCEMHFQADVAAGEAWGLLIAERLMQQPVFQEEFERARQELAGAGLAASNRTAASRAGHQNATVTTAGTALTANEPLAR